MANFVDEVAEAKREAMKECKFNVYLKIQDPKLLKAENKEVITDEDVRRACVVNGMNATLKALKKRGMDVGYSTFSRHIARDCACYFEEKA